MTTNKPTGQHRLPVLIKKPIWPQGHQRCSHQRCDKERPPLKEWSSSLLFSVHEKTRVGSMQEKGFLLNILLIKKKKGALEKRILLPNKKNEGSS